MPGLFFALLGLAVVHWLISIRVLRSNPNAPANKAFASFAFCAGWWTVSIALAHYMTRWTLSFTRLTFLLAGLMVFAFARMAFMTTSATHVWYSFRGYFVVTTALFSSLAATSYIVADALIVNNILVVRYGTAHGLYAAHVLIYLTTGLCVLIHSYRRSSGLSRVRLRYLLIGLSIPIMGAVITNLMVPLLFKQSHMGFYGPLFSIVFFLFAAHAFIRHRLLDVTFVVRRSVTWVLALLVSFIPLLSFLTFFWSFFSARFEPVELALLLACSMVLGLLTPVMHDFSARALDKYVYRSRANYQKTLRDTSRLLTRVLNLNTLVRLIGEAIADFTGSAFVIIFLKEQDGVFRSVAQGAEPTKFRPRWALPLNIQNELLATKEPLATERTYQDLEWSGPPSEPESHCTLFLPIVSDDILIGAIALGTKRSGDPFYSEDIDLLSTLANQAGVAIKNAQLYEQVVLINEYLQNIVGTIESGVIAINQTEHVTIFNPAAEQLTGLVAETVRGYSSPVLPAALAEPLRATAKDGQQRVLAEVELPRPDGSALPVICLTSALREPAGGLLGAVAVFSDLTPLKQLETERRRAERLAYFEALAAGIAHEIKNPLVAIKTFSQLLPRKFHDEQFRERFGRIVAREVGRMEHLVDRLRALAKPGGRPHHALDLRAPITDALELLQPRLEEKRIEILWTPGGEPRAVLGDHEELEQLFLNLFINALEAMEPGGTLAVRLGAAEGSTTVEIDDTGPGIPEELLGKIFDPFVTTKPHGSGLGLAICASIANAHRARIHVANKSVGCGAVFAIEFSAEVMAPAPVNA